MASRKSLEMAESSPLTVRHPHGPGSTASSIRGRASPSRPSPQGPRGVPRRRYLACRVRLRSGTCCWWSGRSRTSACPSASWAQGDGCERKRWRGLAAPPRTPTPPQPSGQAQGRGGSWEERTRGPSRARGTSGWEPPHPSRDLGDAPHGEAPAPGPGERRRGVRGGPRAGGPGAPGRGPEGDARRDSRGVRAGLVGTGAVHVQRDLLPFAAAVVGVQGVDSHLKLHLETSTPTSCEGAEAPCPAGPRQPRPCPAPSRRATPQERRRGLSPTPGDLRLDLKRSFPVEPLLPLPPEESAELAVLGGTSRRQWPRGCGPCRTLWA